MLLKTNSTLRLYDTYRRGVYPFSAITAKQDNHVSLYACGPTVYDYAHVGNLRSYLFVDILRRTLEFNGYELNHVMNITDVGHLTSDADQGEDKMEKGARRTGKTAWQIAAYFEQAFLQDLQKLQIKLPTTLCRATEHIAEQISYIEALEENGFTYVTADGVYFDTQQLQRKGARYGHLARLDIAGLQGGIRVDVAGKKHLTDFALWKFSRGQVRQMQWPSPWGEGFPGWHIECSAMSEKYLGQRFDIHVGGEDHIPVHHTNEIAQCEGRHGIQPANFWMHGYFLQLGKEKISKSGTSLLLSDLEDKGFNALDYRYLTLTAHYRSHLQFSYPALEAAAKALSRLRRSMNSWPDNGEVISRYVDLFTAQINNDLQMPQALAVLWALVKSDEDDANKKATIHWFDQVLALDLNRAAVTLQIPQQVLDLAEQREQARQSKDWLASDVLRAQLFQLGYRVEDSKKGFQLHKLNG